MMSFTIVKKISGFVQMTWSWFSLAMLDIQPLSLKALIKLPLTL